MNPPAESPTPLRTRLTAMIAVLAASAFVAACSTTDDDETTENADTQATPATQAEEQPLDAETEKGKELFVDNCGTCHTLDAAGTQGSIGPNLDEAQVDQAEVLEVIAQGGRGSGNMPANLVTGADAEAVAKFVADSGPGT
jgi:mono/diheme cytochrome c family protein